jgi:hypothetical protein
MIKKNALRVLASSAAVAGLALGMTGTAQAQDGFTNGAYMASTSVSFVGCSGEVQAGTSNSNGEVYARGWFTLNTSTRGLTCKGWLQRSTNGGSSWTTVSDIHEGFGGAVVGTDYYYDQGTDRVRVCVGDLDFSNSYSCGAGW